MLPLILISHWSAAGLGFIGVLAFNFDPVSGLPRLHNGGGVASPARNDVRRR